MTETPDKMSCCVTKCHVDMTKCHVVTEVEDEVIGVSR